MKKTFLLIVALVLLLAPLLAYFFNFRSFEISKDIKDWADFGSYLNGTFMPLIVLAGSIITWRLGIISESRNKTTLKLDQQKHRPLMHLSYYDAEDKIEIKIENKGLGALTITNYQLINLLTKESKGGIFECLPEVRRGYFENYSGNQNNYVLKANEEKQLLLLEKRDTEKNEDFIKDVERVRIELAKYKVVIDYKDVYDTQMPTYERSLEWFGRNSKNKK